MKGGAFNYFNICFEMFILLKNLGTWLVLAIHEWVQPLARFAHIVSYLHEWVNSPTCLVCVSLFLVYHVSGTTVADFLMRLSLFLV